MAEGILAEVQDGFAHIQFLDKAKVGPSIAKLLEIGGPELIDVDTRSNPRKTYIVPEGMAKEAGLLDDSEPSPESGPASEPQSDIPDGDPSESWTVPQLRAYAKREEISLAGADKKADILAVINTPKEPAIITPPAPAPVE